MNIEEIAKRIAELHYPNKPNAIIDEPYRLVRMKTLRQQVETELKNCFIPDVIDESFLAILDAYQVECQMKYNTGTVPDA